MPTTPLQVRRVPLDALHQDPATVSEHGDANTEATLGSLKSKCTAVLATATLSLNRIPLDALRVNSPSNGGYGLPADDWREIPGFNGYAVTSNGEVWSCRDFQGSWDPRSWRKLRPHVSKEWGHLQVHLRREGRTYVRWIHRLVLQSFVGPCPDGMECRHLDGNSANNAIENLAWGTARENHEDQRRHGTLAIGAAHPMAKLTPQAVEALRTRAVEGVAHTRIAKEFGISQTHASAIIRGEYWRQQ